jgi:hypothetical protein
MRLRRQRTTRIEHTAEAEPTEAETLQRFRTNVRRIFQDLDRNGDNLLHKVRGAFNAALIIVQQVYVAPLDPNAISCYCTVCLMSAGRGGSSAEADGPACEPGAHQDDLRML